MDGQVESSPLDSWRKGIWAWPTARAWMCNSHNGMGTPVMSMLSWVKEIDADANAWIFVWIHNLALKSIS